MPSAGLLDYPKYIESVIVRDSKIRMLRVSGIEISAVVSIGVRSWAFRRSSRSHFLDRIGVEHLLFRDLYPSYLMFVLKRSPRYSVMLHVCLWSSKACYLK